MQRDERRGCIKLKNAQVGIEEKNDCQFTIAVNNKKYHFEAQDAKERGKWVDALQEARDLHTHNYPLMNQTARLFDHPSRSSEFNKHIIEVDAYLQILIELKEQLSTDFADSEDYGPEAIGKVVQHLSGSTFTSESAIIRNDLRNEAASSSTTYCSAPSSPKLIKGHHRGLPDDQSGHDAVSMHLPQQPTSSLPVTRSKSSVLSSVAHVDAAPPKYYSDVSELSDEDDGELSDDGEEYFDSMETHSSSLLVDQSTSRPGFLNHFNRSPAAHPLIITTPPTPASPKPFPTPLSTTNSNQSEDAADHKHTDLPIESSTSLDKYHDELYDDPAEADLDTTKPPKSMISHLLSQLRIGMDLTRITLPTYILERRSTLEMFADFLAHADLWSAIAAQSTPRTRFIACLRWYLSAFHAGRQSSVAKKPYNPVLGEVFKCFWPLEAAQVVNGSSPPKFIEESHRNGPVPWAPPNSVVFLSEQVSHHPPISSFYAENLDQSIMIDGHLWTKSNFYGVSIGVDFVGAATITLLDHQEEYVVTFPSGYGKNILTTPTFELGGKTSIVCSKTGYVANIDFKTTTMLSSRMKDHIHVEAFELFGDKPFLIIDGRWNGQMVAKWNNEGSGNASDLFVDTSKAVMKKHVQPRSEQADNESRRLWETVTSNLKQGNIDAATDAKCRIEQHQRDLARQRLEANIQWNPVHFRNESDNWTYRNPASQRLYRFRKSLT